MFNIAPPIGAKVVQVDTGKAHANATRPARSDCGAAGTVTSRGVKAVAQQLPFRLVAPSTLVGLPRRDVTLLDWGGHPAGARLLRTEPRRHRGDRAAGASAGKTFGMGSSANGRDHRGLSLPTVSINGVTGQELDTALGTVVRFTRGGVTYTVLGSVPAAAADAAARAL